MWFWIGLTIGIFGGSFAGVIISLFWFERTIDVAVNCTLARIDRELDTNDT